MKSPFLFLLLIVTFSGTNLARGGSATWNLNPTSGDWNTAANWTPATVPNGPSDIATFGSSNTLSILAQMNIEVAGVTFTSGASSFSFTQGPAPFIPSVVTFTLSGTGVSNQSSVTQSFTTVGSSAVGGAAEIHFINNASAGANTMFMNNAAPFTNTNGGRTIFMNTSTAGGAAFLNNAGPSNGNPSSSGMTNFSDSSNAGSATITNLGGSSNMATAGATNFTANSSADHAVILNRAPSNEGFSGTTNFSDQATAANASITNEPGTAPARFGGFTNFGGTSTAGTATFDVQGSSISGGIGGYIQFFDDSTAGDATFALDGGQTSGAGGGAMAFLNGGNGGNATMVNNGGSVLGSYGGYTQFSVGSNAGNSTLVANGGPGSFSGGSINFDYDSDGGTSLIIVYGNGNLRITNHDDTTPVGVGSVEGNGVIFIGYRDLIVGRNNLNTIFAGGITSQGGDGTVTKVGRGRWTLTGNSSYTAGTFINGGKLIVNSTTGSGTGTSPVQVNRGVLAGNGIVGGSVIVGSGRGEPASISPGSRGDRSIGTLAIQNSVTFNSDGSYDLQINSTTVRSDSLNADGVVINSGAQLNATDLGNSSLSVGTTFVALDNTAATAITGSFAGLPEGAITTIGGNNFQASYVGGDGNDLTLTVVP